MIPAGALIRNREVPELGSGRVIAELEDGAVRVAFENSEEVNEVRLEHADIVRQPLIPGTLVKVQRGETVEEGEIVEVEWPETPRELCAYVVRIDGSDEPVFESQIIPIAPKSSSPRDQLAALHWRGPFRFFSRWDMHRMISRWYEDSEGLPTAIGARIEPAPHHAHGVRRVLWDTATRHLLADEDPQARLYEAGMIAQRMYAERPDLRVLVIASGRRSHRWQADLEQRFGGRSYMRVDASHLAANPPSRWASVSDNERLIVSTGCLQQFPDACTDVVLDGDWDLVIVDDAHRLRPNDPAYNCLRAVALENERMLLLSALPAELDADKLSWLFGLLEPGSFDADDPGPVEARIERLEGVWGELVKADGLLAELDEAGDDQIAETAESLAEAAGDDAYVDTCVEASKDGDRDALQRLVDYLRENYRLDRRIVRCRRPQLAEYDVEWNERSLETLEYTPDNAEESLAGHLDDLVGADAIDPLALAMRALYFSAAASTPDRFFMLLEQRLDALGATAAGGAADLPIFDLWASDLSPVEEEMLEDELIATAPELEGEGEWIAGAMSIVGQWHADATVDCARFEAAGDWIEDYLAQEPDEEEETARPAKIVVNCTNRQTAQDFSLFLESRLDTGAVALIQSGMGSGRQDDAAELFRRDPECRVLVCDEAGASGRDISFARAIVHLEQPWAPTRVEARIARLDQTHRNTDAPIHSVVLVGPTTAEQTLQRLYDDVLGIYESARADREFELADIDRDVWLVAGRSAEALEGLIERAASEVEAGADERDRAFRHAHQASDAQLEADADFADLLDFIDGVADSLPIRHWARMLGMQDHSAGPGVFDFKWHWKNVRRPLAGYDITPGDLDFLMPEEQVGMMSGTFSRKRALRSEHLDFFAPGHRFIDALVEDALNPTDGRATIFARRLGPPNRGKLFLNVIALTGLDADVWSELDMPRGLINRAHRHVWPESISAVVQFDLQGRRAPKLVEDWELIQKVEESYQGPEADQKIEYEVFLQAIEDAARFRGVLDDAVEIGLEHLREQRAGLVEGGAAELVDDLQAEMAYFEMEKARGENPRAEVELMLREKLIESVRNERIELDALGVVVGGTPQILIR